MLISAAANEHTLLFRGPFSHQDPAQSLLIIGDMGKWCLYIYTFSNQSTHVLLYSSVIHWSAVNLLPGIHDSGFSLARAEGKNKFDNIILLLFTFRYFLVNQCGKESETTAEPRPQDSGSVCLKRWYAELRQGRIVYHTVFHIILLTPLLLHQLSQVQ